MSAYEERTGKDLYEEPDDEKHAARLARMRKAATALYKEAIAKKGERSNVATQAFASFAPLHAAAKVIEKDIAIIEAKLADLARQLPVAAWIERDVRGVGLLSLAAIIGEAGDLAGYERVSQLWKRMGVAVIDGERQRKCADANKAMRHGYTPERRAVIWVVGDGLIKQGEALREFYLARKAVEAEKIDPKTGKPVRKIVAHLRAKRVMEKRFLKMLLKRWKAESAAA
jgi:hypothetical protein